jgi:hypothetical protein
MPFWTFMDYLELTGRNPIAEWIEGLPQDVQDRISERLSFWEQVERWSEKWASAYKGTSGLYELRLTFKRVPYRPLFVYGPGRRMILLCGSIEQNGKLPRADLKTADRRRKEWEKDPTRVIRHKF